MQKDLELHPRFTLLVGDNGAGKTSMLDALAIAAGVWLVKPPDSTLVNSGRNILKSEIRLEARTEGDRTRLYECRPVMVSAEGEILGKDIKWLRQIRSTGARTSNSEAKNALNIIQEHYSRVQNGDKFVTPVLAYYGAGRSWLPSRNRRLKGTKGRGQARRWEAFYDCFDERIRLIDLEVWFRNEAIAFARKGEWRSGYRIVKDCILSCVPGADNLWYDVDRDEIVLSIEQQVHTFANLGAGQRMMVALIADIAIKVVTQNAHLITDEQHIDVDQKLPEVLQQTPGLILIDEIDAHLHPNWQRRIIGDLKRMFPMIQFVCTSHSPFIIQSLKQDELRTLDESGPILVQYANQSIEDIAEDIQKVEIPQQSRSALELSRATERYFSLLGKGKGCPRDELLAAEVEYRKASERYSESPGLDAILKLEAMKHEVDRSS